MRYLERTTFTFWNRLSLRSSLKLGLKLSYRLRFLSEDVPCLNRDSR